MKKIILFHLDDCPYCHYAKRALKELVQENEAYGTIHAMDRGESAFRAFLQYFYYYVPTIFYGEEKHYEAHPSESYSDVKEHIRAALDKVRES